MTNIVFYNRTPLFIKYSRCEYFTTIIKICQHLDAQKNNNLKNKENVAQNNPIRFGQPVKIERFDGF